MVRVTIGERVLDTQWVEGAPVEDAAAAKSKVREQVRMRLDDPVKISIIEGRLGDHPFSIERQRPSAWIGTS
mgnify:CR=1 FL=1